VNWILKHLSKHKQNKTNNHLVSIKPSKKAYLSNLKYNLKLNKLEKLVSIKNRSNTILIAYVHSVIETEDHSKNYQNNQSNY
jgi:hypothetical protein